MEIINLSTIIVLKVDLKKVRMRRADMCESLRQELGVILDSTLSGSRYGHWIGGRTKNNKIYLLFRVSDPTKAKICIKKMLDNCGLPSNAKIKIKQKTIIGSNYAFI
jgi:hypothetical protein